MEYFYCKLETERTEVSSLERRIDSSFLDRSFDDLLIYMMNPAGDENNPAYEGDQVTVLEDLNLDYNARADPDFYVSLNAIIDGGVNEIEVPFDARVGASFSDISEDVAKDNGSGSQEIFKQIYLIVQKYVVG